jgi:hypothetical protein
MRQLPETKTGMKEAILQGHRLLTIFSGQHFVVFILREWGKAVDLCVVYVV